MSEQQGSVCVTDRGCAFHEIVKGSGAFEILPLQSKQWLQVGGYSPEETRNECRLIVNWPARSGFPAQPVCESSFAFIFSLAHTVQLFHDALNIGVSGIQLQ